MMRVTQGFDIKPGVRRAAAQHLVFGQREPFRATGIMKIDMHHRYGR
jgi:hypothetical protein